MSYRKIAFLVPEPDCSTWEGEITEWRDSRPQPTQAEIDAVTEEMIDAADKAKDDERLEGDGDLDYLLIIAKGFHDHENRLRVGEGLPPVTLEQVIKGLKNL